MGPRQLAAVLDADDAKPDVKVVAELFPKLGAADFSTEISRLGAKPDVILSTAISIHLFVNQPARSDRAIVVRAATCRKFARTSWRRPAWGVIVGARGDNYFLNQYKDKPDFKAFVEASYQDQRLSDLQCGAMAQSLFALRNAMMQR